MARRILLVPAALLLLSASVAGSAPPTTDREALERLSTELHRRAAAYRPPGRADTTWARLLDDPDVLLVGRNARGQHIAYVPENLSAAATIATPPVWEAPYLITGAAMTAGRLGMWDVGAALLAHQEFTGRVVQADGAAVLHEHATKVAGTMIAAGVFPDAHGMAPTALLSAYDADSDDAEMAAAAAAGMLISNHSYGQATGWQLEPVGDTYIWLWWGDTDISATEDYMFGFYSEQASQWDEIAHLAPAYTIVTSAGNDRNDHGTLGQGSHQVRDPETGLWIWSTAWRDPDGGADGFDSLPPTGVAKNIITVGAVEPLPDGYSGPWSVNVTAFSSWGPTDDGRIKPDLVAAGLDLVSCDDDNVADYAPFSGTSAAAPGVSGSAALVVEAYLRMYGQPPLSSTVKALLIAAADEAGDSPGPDYQHGWGLMNTRRSVDLVQAGAASEHVLAAGKTARHTFVAPKSEEPVKVVLCWTDPPGTPPAPALNPADPLLVHDLDLRVVTARATHEPWVLDPTDPAAPASRGDNVRDNVEVIETMLEGTFQVVVSHKGTLAADQAYSLVVTSGAWAEVTGFSLRDEYLPQDAFPASLEVGQDHDVPVDAAADISPPGGTTVVPGDSIVVELMVAEGQQLLAPPEMVYLLLDNPEYAHAVPCYPSTGTITADTVFNGSGDPVPFRWSFAPPDEDFLYPGDVLRFYFRAEVEVEPGLPEEVTAPEDLSGFDDSPGPGPSPWPLRHTMHALPTVLDPSTGEQPPLLLWLDAGDQDVADVWFHTLAQLALVVGEDIDVFVTRAPERGLGNGLGGRATPSLLAGYEVLLYESGPRETATITECDPAGDKGDDIGLLDAWLQQDDRGMILCGDHLVADLVANTPTTAFDSVWAGVDLLAPDLATVIGGQESPVTHVLQPLYQVGGWTVMAGLPALRSFNGVRARSAASREAEYLDPYGVGGLYPAAALVLLQQFQGGHTSISFTLANGLDVVGSQTRDGTAVRTELLGDMLDYIGAWPGSGPVLVPHPSQSSAVIDDAAIGASLYSTPAGTGRALTRAFTPDGAQVDATITVTVRDWNGFPVYAFPPEDIWLEGSLGSLITPVGGACADHPTDAMGRTTFSGPLHAGGYADVGGGEQLLVVIIGEPLLGSPLPLLFNSADLDGNLELDFYDIALFGPDLIGGQNDYRSDLCRDGSVDLWDWIYLHKAWQQAQGRREE